MMRRESRANGDSGSGSILGLTVIGAVTALVLLGVPMWVGLGIRESLATAADAAALAGADVATGLAPGSPCSVSAVVAAANRTSLAACDVDGLVVTVRVQTSFLGLQLATSATAGPPVVVTN
jgi:secretion/DNA translocation related TadE-like protein